jgi:hypothetical protein
MLGITCGLYAGPATSAHPRFGGLARSARDLRRSKAVKRRATSGTIRRSCRIIPGGLTRDHVVWAYRLLLDRDPESEDAIGPKLAGSRDTRELRRHLMTSAEFQEKNRDYAHTNDRTVVIKELDSGVRLFVDLSDHVIGLAIVRGRYERTKCGWRVAS